MSEKPRWAHKTTPGSDHEFCTIYEDRPGGRAVARHVTPENAVIITQACNNHDDLLAIAERLISVRVPFPGRIPDLAKDDAVGLQRTLAAIVVDARAAIVKAEGKENGK